MIWLGVDRRAEPASSSPSSPSRCRGSPYKAEPAPCPCHHRHRPGGLRLYQPFRDHRRKLAAPGPCSGIARSDGMGSRSSASRMKARSDTTSSWVWTNLPVASSCTARAASRTCSSAHEQCRTRPLRPHPGPGVPDPSPANQPHSGPMRQRRRSPAPRRADAGHDEMADFESNTSAFSPNSSCNPRCQQCCSLPDNSLGLRREWPQKTSVTV